MRRRALCLWMQRIDVITITTRIIAAAKIMTLAAIIATRPALTEPEGGGVGLGVWSPEREKGEGGGGEGGGGEGGGGEGERGENNIR